MPRTETNHGVNYVLYTTAKTIDNNDGSSSVTSSVQPAGSYSRVRSTVNSPNFRSSGRGGKRRIRKADLPMNAFYFYESRRAPMIGVQQQVYNATLPNNKGNTLEVAGVVPTGPYVDGPTNNPDLDDLEYEARGRLLDRLKDQSINLGQAFGERKQTEKLFVDAVDRLSKAAGYARHGAWGKAADSLGVSLSRAQERKIRRNKERPAETRIAVGWLELQYGWLPLLSDIKGGAEAVAKAHLRASRTRVVSSSSWSDSREENGFNLGVPMRTVEKHKANVKYVLYFADSQNLNGLVGTGITNPLAVAWELLPWSFVYDWVLPVGNYLNSLDATLGLDFQKGCVTYFRRFSKTLVCSGSSIPDIAGNHNEGFWSASRFEVECRRVPLTGFPPPHLPRVKNPFPANGTGATRIANALALMKTAFGRGASK